MKYNRAFIKVDDKHPLIRKLLDNTGNEELDYWIVDSKESFHGEQDGKNFHFKDSRIDSGTILPLDCVKLEFSEEELKDLKES